MKGIYLLLDARDVERAIREYYRFADPLFKIRAEISAPPIRMEFNLDTHKIKKKYSPETPETQKALDQIDTLIEDWKSYIVNKYQLNI
jgi:hypothetical protein